MEKRERVSVTLLSFVFTFCFLVISSSHIFGESSVLNLMIVIVNFICFVVSGICFFGNKRKAKFVSECDN